MRDHGCLKRIFWEDISRTSCTYQDTQKNHPSYMENRIFHNYYFITSPGSVPWCAGIVRPG